MRRLILLIALVVLVVILAKLPVSVVSDTSTLPANSSIPDSEVTSTNNKRVEGCRAFRNHGLNCEGQDIE